MAAGASAARKRGSLAWQHTMLVLLNLAKNQVAEPWFLAAALTSLRFLFWLGMQLGLGVRVTPTEKSRLWGTGYR